MAQAGPRAPPAPRGRSCPSSAEGQERARSDPVARCAEGQRPMDARTPADAAPRGRINATALVNRLRLATGLVMFSYVTTHLLNHALGIVSLDAMLAIQVGFVAAWHFLPVTVLLLGSFVIHASLALWSLYRRRRLRMPPWE